MIWITGAEGMLGRELCGLLKDKDIPFTATDRECDVADISVLTGFTEGKEIDWIVNCSAYTAVDMAEDEPEKAFSINEAGALNLALTAERIGAKLVHISTDYVFDGTGSRPYREDDTVNPLGVYGRSKLAGETGIVENTGRYFIIRTSWLYGEHGGNFVHTMLRLFNEIDSLPVVNDQRGTPTWTRDLSEAVFSLIKSESDMFGVYHYSGDGDITWYDFACEIYKEAQSRGLTERKVAIVPVTSEQYPSRVKRPSYSVMNSSKIAGISGVKIHPWRRSLGKFLDSKRKQDV